MIFKFYLSVEIKKTFEVYHNGFEISFSHIFDQHHFHLPKKSQSGHICQNFQCTLRRQKNASLHFQTKCRISNKKYVNKKNLRIFQEIN